MPKKNINFEENITKLEKIVSELESGETGLDKSIELFEEGVKLTNECLKILDTAQQKIKLLTEDKEGNITEGDFDDNDE